MPRPPINLHQKVRAVVQHVGPLHAEADRPVQHFERSVNAALQLLAYLDAHIDPNDVYAAVYERHLSQLRRMILAEFIEAFERFSAWIISLPTPRTTVLTILSRSEATRLRRS